MFFVFRLETILFKLLDRVAWVYIFKLTLFFYMWVGWLSFGLLSFTCGQWAGWLGFTNLEGAQAKIKGA